MRTTLKLLAALLAAGQILGGCGLPLQNMSAEQLRELAKVKDAAVTCVIINTPYGQARAVFLNVDKGVIPQGTVQVDDACKATITSGAAK